jgi:hypothetical protein
MGYYTEIQEIYVDSGTPSEILTFYVGSTITVHGWLNTVVGGYAKSLPKKTVDIYANNTKVASSVTDGTGLFFAYFTINTPGTYSVYAKFPGDSEYNPCESDKTTIIVKEKAPTVYVTKISFTSPDTVYQGQKFEASGTLYYDSTPLPDMYVKLYIDGVVKQTVKTDANGNFSFSVDISEFAVGSHTAYAGFDGTDKYMQSTSDKKTFTIKGKTTTGFNVIEAPDPVTVNKPFTAKSQLLKYTITGWEPLPGKKVTISFDGTKVTEVTSGSDGSVSADIVITNTGEFTIKFSFAGDDEYLPSEKTKKITVSTGVGAVEGYVYDKETKRPLPNFEVWLETPERGAGTFFKTYTNSNGYYIFRNLPAGPRRMTVPPQGDYDIESATVTIVEGQTAKQDFYLSKKGAVTVPGIEEITKIPWWVWVAAGGLAIGGILIIKAATSKPTVTVVMPGGGKE